MRKKEKTKLKFIIGILIFSIAIFVVFKFFTKNNKMQNEEVANTVAEEVNKEQETEIKEEKILEYSKKQKEIKEKRISEEKMLGKSGLPVLMYHFFYDTSKGEKGQDGNWIEISKFEEQIKYLSENEFYFPTWQEVEDYIDGKQALPEKSVVITVDDGDPSFFELAVPIIQKYDVYATSFVVTYWYGDRANDKQNNISYQSHSYDMHKAGKNGKGVMLSWEYDKIKEDLELSSNVLGGANVFCYPFGQYVESNFKVLKDAGYKLAFTTKDGKVTTQSSKYELPRVRVSAQTSLNSFVKKVE